MESVSLGFLEDISFNLHSSECKSCRATSLGISQDPSANTATPGPLTLEQPESGLQRDAKSPRVRRQNLNGYLSKRCNIRSTWNNMDVNISQIIEYVNCKRPSQGLRKSLAI